MILIEKRVDKFYRLFCVLRRKIFIFVLRAINAQNLVKIKKI